MDTVVIVNPNAGGGTALEELRSHIDELSGFEIRETRKAGDALRLARQAADEGVARVVAAGGDGTLNEVINGLAPDFRPVVGLIPLGTGNDFCRIAGIPGPVAEAMDVLESGAARRIDVVRMTAGDDGDERWFVNVSAGGFSGEVSESNSTEVKASWGPLSYLVSALDVASELTSYRTRLTFDRGRDHEATVELELINLVVANGSHAASGVEVAPGARLDDGLFDVVLIKNAPMASLSILAGKIGMGLHREDDLVVYRRAERLDVESSPPFDVNADGELVGSSPVAYEIFPGAVQLAAPPADERENG
jgi:diacylglycerol kinase (ATP)